MELALFLALAYAVSIVAGGLLERIRVPWLFAALLLGVGLAAWNPFPAASGSAEFSFLAELGMYLFLFVVGFEMSLPTILRKGKFILLGAVAIIVLETVVGSIFIHFVFGTPWHVAAVVGLSFATVGEAVLLPILKEFKMVETDLGQTILGIGLVDNIFEVLAVVLVAVILVTGSAGGGASGGGEGSGTHSGPAAGASEEAQGSSGSSGGANRTAGGGSKDGRGETSPDEGGRGSGGAGAERSSTGDGGHGRALSRSPKKLSLPVAFGAIAGLFVLTFLLRRIPGEKTQTLMEKLRVTRPREVGVAMSLVVFFGFITLGSFAEAGALAALLAGLAVKPFIPPEDEEGVAHDIQIIAYGIFGPLFFLSVGINTNVDYLLSVPFIVLSLMLIVKATKIGASLLVGYWKLGLKKSLVMGVSLAVKFSTSLVIVKLLFDLGQIDRHLYSVLIAVKIAFKFVVPFLLAWMLTRWDLGEDEPTAAETG